MPTSTLATLRAMEEDALAAGVSDVGTLNMLYAWMLSLRPHATLQVGGLIGYGAVVLSHAARVNGFGRVYTIEPNQQYVCRIQDYCRRAEVSDYHTVWPGYSYDQHLLDEAKARGPFQLIYVDALHDYQAVLQDLRLYGDLLDRGGVMVLHDASVAAQEFDAQKEGGVRRAALEYFGQKQCPVLFTEHPTWLNPVGAAIAIRNW